MNTLERKILQQGSFLSPYPKPDAGMWQGITTGFTVFHSIVLQTGQAPSFPIFPP